MSETIRVFAGDCTTTFEGSRSRTQRGRVVVVVKPDRTVLVHDADGYQPVSWLTRPDSLTVETDRSGFGLVARADEQVLRIRSHETSGWAEYPASEAGVPVGSHPQTGEPLVRVGGAVVGLDTETRYGLPAGATVVDETCDDCGLPKISAECGAVFELCVDRACESLDDAVRDRFDDEWTCPDCGSPLSIIRRGGRLLAGCSAYPDCETAFSIPAGVVVDDCDCGLPVFETARGRRCLDGTCAQFE
ncbi:nuclease of the recb family protein [Halogeometricum borinquense DSM 11551]|uniref:Nuclease of the recb family protein n=1 Tax=Halogeometricum borinquense (strain ATCC 700274 / DSM 11551 / JCM 10706 / KCTC 4070 / PR3) TaxID=469382 RepID=E4NTG9_HALBP|nr:endonuclease NucS domain-containing protein [Halogeometricum borinquense]ADQ65914.1 predicted nuclease of the RecB family [Halogeometricum borinquense DSM 11551]ELY26272.1 nuclease of the recb family protein [Halogeometricum borinquense DSM 11551]